MTLFSRRRVLTSIAATTLPIWPAAAQTGTGTESCRMSDRQGAWSVAARISESTTSDNTFGKRSIIMRLRHSTPEFHIELMYPSGDSAGQISRKAVTKWLFPGPEILAQIRAQTQPVIDARKPNEPVADKSGLGLQLTRRGGIVLRGAEEGNRRELFFEVIHGFDRFQTLSGKGANVIERETWTVKPDVEQPARDAAFEVLTSGGRVALSGHVYGPSDKSWARIYSGQINSDDLNAVILRAQATLLSRAKKFEPQTCAVEGCFLTTACCSYMGRADDCFELRTLRAFRDSWLSAQPQGRDLIKEYYRMAPALCRAMAENTKELRRIYWTTILPCVVAIQLCADRLAFRLYARMVSRLQAAYPAAA